MNTDPNERNEELNESELDSVAGGFSHMNPEDPTGELNDPGHTPEEEEGGPGHDGPEPDEGPGGPIHI
jgi:hypothetical protein